MHCSAVVQWTLYGEGIKGVPIAIGTKMVGFGQPARVYIHKNQKLTCTPPPFSVERKMHTFTFLVLSMVLEESQTSPFSHGNMQNGFQMALHIPGSKFRHLLPLCLTKAIDSTYLYNRTHLPFRGRHDLGSSGFLLCNHSANF